MSENEDLNLSNNMEKLEIDKVSSIKNDNDNESPNPFMRKRSKSLSSINFGTHYCECSKNLQSIKHTTSFKKTQRKILREPILKYVKCSHNNSDCKVSKFKVGLKRKDRLFGYGSHNDQDFKTIINGCEQLTVCDFKKYSSSSFQSARLLSNDNLQSKILPKSDNNNVGTTSCSTQARMNTAPPCDITIDELASYFETLVHIPKKMSSMAEMMYI